MNKNTIIKLNQLNQEFYKQVADSFSQTRNQPWLGWEQLAPHVNKIFQQVDKPSFLDIGCGNGRWAEFLVEKFKLPFSYFGMDNNDRLLEIANQKLSSQIVDNTFIKFDLVSNLLNNQTLHFSNLNQADVITIFGVLHHLPSFELRSRTLIELSKLLNKDSLLIFSAWQFAYDQRFQEKVTSPTKIGINELNLEANDYILTWQNNKTAFRYCHHIDDEEIKQLLLSSKLKQIDSFQADGKTGQLNRYIVAQK